VPRKTCAETRNTARPLPSACEQLDIQHTLSRRHTRGPAENPAPLAKQGGHEKILVRSCGSDLFLQLRSRLRREFHGGYLLQCTYTEPEDARPPCVSAGAPMSSVLASGSNTLVPKPLAADTATLGVKGPGSAFQTSPTRLNT
jgi:hypothetical protein